MLIHNTARFESVKNRGTFLSLDESVFILVVSQNFKRQGIDCLPIVLRLSMLSEHFYATLNQNAVRFDVPMLIQNAVRFESVIEYCVSNIYWCVSVRLGKISKIYSC